jgi:hypothetical protein
VLGSRKFPLPQKVIVGCLHYGCVVAKGLVDRAPGSADGENVFTEPPRTSGLWLFCLQNQCTAMGKCGGMSIFFWPRHMTTNLLLDIYLQAHCCGTICNVRVRLDIVVTITRHIPRVRSHHSKSVIELLAILYFIRRIGRVLTSYI